MSGLDPLLAEYLPILMFLGIATGMALMAVLAYSTCAFIWWRSSS
jgi:hypothetical protein